MSPLGASGSGPHGEDVRLLDSLGERHAEFLHARGETATRLLIDRLGCSKGDAVLDLGCGTGATLVSLASRYPGISLSGVDISHAMLDAAASRLKFCRLAERVALHPAAPSGALPFGDGAFDRIYGESVLAILDDPAAEAVTSELRRVLAPGGRACFNETLWREGTPMAEIERINGYCLAHFGIIQSSRTRASLSDWMSFFGSHGLSVISAEPIDAIPVPPGARNAAERTSRLFTLAGRLKEWANPRRSRRRRRFESAARSLVLREQRMEGILFTLRREP